MFVEHPNSRVVRQKEFRYARDLTWDFNKVGNGVANDRLKISHNVDLKSNIHIKKHDTNHLSYYLLV